MRDVKVTKEIRDEEKNKRRLAINAFNEFVEKYRECADYTFKLCSCESFYYTKIPDGYWIKLEQSRGPYVAVSLFTGLGIIPIKTDSINTILCSYIQGKKNLRGFKIERNYMEDGGSEFSYSGNIYLMKFMENNEGFTCFSSFKKFKELKSCKKEIDVAISIFNEFVKFYEDCKESKDTKCSCRSFDYTRLPDNYRIKLEQQRAGIAIYLFKEEPNVLTWLSFGTYRPLKQIGNPEIIQYSTLCTYIPLRKSGERMVILDKDFEIEKSRMDHGDGTIFSHEGYTFLMKYDRQHVCFPVVSLGNYNEFKKIRDCA